MCCDVFCHQREPVDIRRCARAELPTVHTVWRPPSRRLSYPCLEAPAPEDTGRPERHACHRPSGPARCGLLPGMGMQMSRVPFTGSWHAPCDMHVLRACGIVDLPHACTSFVAAARHIRGTLEAHAAKLQRASQAGSSNGGACRSVWRSCVLGPLHSTRKLCRAASQLVVDVIWMSGPPHARAQRLQAWICWLLAATPC